jgi:TnpA family transposase
MGTKAAFTSRYPKAGPLLTGKIDKALIARHWDDLLRLAASLKFGHVTASLIVGKLSASDRQNALAAALKEYGALRCTIFAARYLTDEAYRRRITRQLNKGENLHALRRDIHFAHEGHVRHRYLEQQTEQALCLTLVTNAIVTWMTEYLGLAVGKLRAEGREVDDELLVHVSPAHHENVILYGSYPIEVERELAELEQTSYRSLREPARREQEATAVDGRFSAAG